LLSATKGKKDKKKKLWKRMEFFSLGNRTWALLKRKVGKTFPQG
jgi:hypothetical protein